MCIMIIEILNERRRSCFVLIGAQRLIGGAWVSSSALCCVMLYAATMPMRGCVGKKCTFHSRLDAQNDQIARRIFFPANTMCIFISICARSTDMDKTHTHISNHSAALDLDNYRDGGERARGLLALQPHRKIIPYMAMASESAQSIEFQIARPIFITTLERSFAILYIGRPSQK